VNYDIVILGAGAAGMMCAISAGRRGRRVVLLDHARKLAPKIKISGGGRCNFTNIHLGSEHFISENPDFCRSALARFTPSDFLSCLRTHSISWHEKKLGQLFCDTSSTAIISMLKHECLEAGAEFSLGHEVSDVRRECLAGSGHTQQHLVAQTTAQAIGQAGDGFGLIAFGGVGGDEFEAGHGRTSEFTLGSLWKAPFGV